ncbi:MAG: two-component system response regulator [bacterium]
MQARRVMVVDDEPFILRSLVYVLKKEGYDVTSAEDGNDALVTIRQSKPEVLFLDVMMPKMDGFELCRIIKSDADLRDIYVILLTAKGQAKDRECAVQAGADEYITKPFRPSLVIEKVRSLLALKVG